MLTINKSAQNILSALTCGYFGVPIALFLLNWYALYISIPLIVLLWVAALLSCKEDANNRIQNFSISGKCLLSTVVLVLLWCYFSGIGGYSFQNSDFHCRNAIFQDLTHYPWPVTFSHEGSDILLVYYFTYWLPAALVAKGLGAQWGLLFLYFWTVTGVLLVIYHVSFYFKKTSLVIPVVLILFSSGCDIIPFLFKSITSHTRFGLDEHFEWWGKLEYSCLTTCLYWVFNQAIPTWLGTAVIINKKSIFSKGFIAALVYPFGPFGFIGLVMLIGIAYLLEVARTRQLPLFGDVKSKIEMAHKAFMALVGLVTVYIFSTFFSTTGRGLVVYTFGEVHLKKAPFRLPSFLLFDFALMALAILLLTRRNKSLLYTAIISLFLIPLVQIVSAGDFIMRVSMPAILIMGVYACAIFLDDFAVKAKPRNMAFLCFFAVCAMTSVSEIFRSVEKTTQAGFRPENYLANDIKSFSNFDSPLEDGGMVNFRSTNYQNSFYWKRLRR